jgi:hypothetical protein
LALDLDFPAALEVVVVVGQSINLIVPSKEMDAIAPVIPGSIPIKVLVIISIPF